MEEVIAMKKGLIGFCVLMLLVAYGIAFAKPQTPAEKKGKIIVLVTNQGSIEIQLWPKVAPKACENFEKLAASGYYNGVMFHRVIKGFMIQGGDPEGTGMGGQSIWGKPFADEVKEDVRFDKVGLVAMANAGPNTNGSQFFITTSTPAHLNMKHTIFGQVIKGYDVVQKIESAQTGPNDRPVAAQKIIKAYVKKS
jgi:peptidylprolyl isomerase